MRNAVLKLRLWTTVLTFSRKRNSLRYFREKQAALSQATSGEFNVDVEVRRADNRCQLRWIAVHFQACTYLLPALYFFLPGKYRLRMTFPFPLCLRGCSSSSARRLGWIRRRATATFLISFLAHFAAVCFCVNFLRRFPPRFDVLLEGDIVTDFALSEIEKCMK